MNRTLTIIILFISILILGGYEIFTVEKMFNTFDNTFNNLQESLIENKNDITPLENNISNILTKWNNIENILCFMFNHKELAPISDSLTKIKRHIINNDYQNAIVEMDYLKEFFIKNRHIMTFNIQHIL